MFNFCGFRPPQFSEDSAWLPSWLHRCDFQQLNVNSIEQDCNMFEHRVEELQLPKNVDEGKLSTEEGGCNIGQLFLSGTDSSSLISAPTTYNVAQYHLCLSSDGNTENSMLTPSAYQSDSKCPFIIHCHENSAILSKPSVRLSLFNYAEMVHSSEKVELQTSTIENQLLKDDENVNSSEAATDAVELCVAASEALVINEIIESESLKTSSASAVLEASLRLKQARWDVCESTFDGLMVETCEMDSLSDLDDRTMESAYDDAGICIDELHVNDFSISLVKDTLDHERDKNLEHEIIASVNICNESYYGSPHKTECTVENDEKIMEEDLSGDSFDGDSQKKVTDNEELKMGPTAAGTSLPEPNLGSSPVTSKNNLGKHHSFSRSVDEKFQSRWFGGWSHDPPQNKVTHTTRMKHNIQQYFVAQTSFLSESDDAAPDESSFVRNKDKRDVIASQLSVPSKKYSNSLKDVTQVDVISSSPSLLDPLCSVVPCSIPESTSTPTNHEDTPPVVSNSIEGCTEGNGTAIPTSNDEFIRGEIIDMVIPDTEESCRGISRRSTSLKNYSKILAAHANFLVKDDNLKDSLLISDNPKLIFKEKDLTNHEEPLRVGTELPFLQKEVSFPDSLVVNRATHCRFRSSNSPIQNPGNPSQTASTDINSKVHPSNNIQRPPLQCITRSLNRPPSSKRVRFSKEEINTSLKYQDAWNASKTCISTRTTKIPSRSSPHLEFRVRKSIRIPKSHLRKEKSGLIFQNMEFLLTGFSKQKEYEIENLIREHGGIILSRIPSTSFKGNSSMFNHRDLPILLCLRKVQSFKFLYGCAVNAFILKVNWLIDSIAAGVVLPPEKYMILSRNISKSHAKVFKAKNSSAECPVFTSLGVMLHGETKYLNNMATIIKHGGGQVFKTFQKLLHAVEAGKISKGVVVSDYVSCASRHLKHCALEKNIPVMSVSWIIRSLYSGRLVPFEDMKHTRNWPSIELQICQNVADLSQEMNLSTYIFCKYVMAFC